MQPLCGKISLAEWSRCCPSRLAPGATVPHAVPRSPSGLRGCVGLGRVTLERGVSLGFRRRDAVRGRLSVCVGPAAAACRRQRGFLGPAEPPREGAWRSTGRGVCVGRARVARCVFALGRRDGGQGSWGRLGACGGASRRRRSLARPRARCVPKLAFYCVNFT
jgi:hypothetical protein